MKTIEIHACLICKFFMFQTLFAYTHKCNIQKFHEFKLGLERKKSKLLFLQPADSVKNSQKCVFPRLTTRNASVLKLMDGADVADLLFDRKNPYLILIGNFCYIKQRYHNFS